MLTFQEHRLLGREAVRKSLVLLKNGKDQKEPFLPLARDAKRILVAGTHADDIGYQCGGWTIAWHGEWKNNSFEYWITEVVCCDFPLSRSML